MRSSAPAALAATSSGIALLCFATIGGAALKAASVDAFVQPRQHVVAARGPGSVEHRVVVSPRHHHHARPGFTGAITIPATAFATITSTRLYSSLSNQDRETSRRSAPSKDSTTALSVSSAVPVQQLDPSPPKVPPPPLPPQQREEGQVSSNEQEQELSATAGFALAMIAATVGLVGLAFLLPQYQDQQRQTSVVTAVQPPPAAVVVSDGGGGGAKLAPGAGGGGSSGSSLESVGIKNIITSAERQQQQQRQAASIAVQPAASSPSSAAPTAATPAVISTDVHHMVTGAAERTATTGSGTGSGDIGISTAAAAASSASASSVGTLTTGTVAEAVSADKLAAGTVIKTSTSDTIGGKDGGAASARGSAGVDTDVKPNIGTNMNMNANTKAIDIDNKADGKEAAPTAMSSAAGAPSAASGTVVKSDAVANIAVKPTHQQQQQQQVAAKEATFIEMVNGKVKEETEPDEFGNTYAAAMVETENKAITTDTEKSSKVLASASTAAAAAVTQQPKTAEPVALQATASAQPEVASNDNKDDETDEFGNTYAIEMEAADAKVDTNMKEVSKASQSSTNAAATKEIAAPATTSTKPTRVATSFSVYSERKSDFLIKTATPDGSSKAASSVSDARLPIYTERH